MKNAIRTMIALFLAVASLTAMVSCAADPSGKIEATLEDVAKQESEWISTGTLNVTNLAGSDSVILSAGQTVARFMSTEGGIAPIMGNASDPMLLAAGEVYLEKTLTATVLPADAPDKTVDWSIALSGNATRKDEAISDYLTVTPSADGATTATVKCYKGFEGDTAVITVTTRVGGFKATCGVIYEGKPTSLAVSTSGKTVVTDSDWNMTMVEVGSGSKVYFPIVTDNLLHAVGSSFTDYAISIETFGGIVINNVTHNNTTGEDSTSTSTMNMRPSNLFESYGYCYASIQTSTGMLVVAHITIENGELAVEGRDAITSYHSISANASSRTEGTFQSYIDGKIPYIRITVTEKNSGLSASVNIKPVVSATSVSLSSEEISF